MLLVRHFIRSWGTRLSEGRRKCIMPRWASSETKESIFRSRLDHYNSWNDVSPPFLATITPGMMFLPPFILLWLVINLDIDIGQTANNQVWPSCNLIGSHQVASSWDYMLSDLSGTVIGYYKIINYAIWARETHRHDHRQVGQKHTSWQDYLKIPPCGSVWLNVIGMLSCSFILLSL